MRRIVLCLVAGGSLVWSACASSAEGGRAAAASRARAGDIGLKREAIVTADIVAKGDTLASLLSMNDVDGQDAAAVVAEAASRFDLRRIRATQPYRLEQSIDGSLRQFEYEIDGDRLLRVNRAGEDFAAEIVPIEKSRQGAIVRGRIDRDRGSLFAAMQAEGETSDLALGLADIFGGEVDFNSELQPGDTFRLAVEKQFRAAEEGSRETRFAGYGPILVAELDNAGRRLRAIRFTPDGGQPGYFDEHGVSMRRFFLRSPLKFEPVVTSGFSRSRLHPVLREYRAHLGIDYRASAGAPVVAVADGLVLAAGASGAAGRMVHLRHANGYETEYLHLSSISVRAGAHVQQGELIGRVGSTGLVTGAHLDYRLKKGGAFVNPLTAQRAMPPADPVPAAQMAAFQAARDRAFGALTTPAAAEVATLHNH